MNIKKDKLKCYVLMIARTFPATHIDKGMPTFFKEKIEKLLKSHTLRSNYGYWKKRIDNVNKGLAYISLREWEGKPYKSDKIEIKRLYAGGIGIQSIVIDKLGKDRLVVSAIDGVFKGVSPTTVANNDGLSFKQFYDWFFPTKSKHDRFEGAIIHFTNYRY